MTETQESKLPRILIVDDEVRNMQALCDTLPAYGFQASGCTSGEEALGALRNESFDLLLTDLMMPGMDGIALIDLARQIDPGLVAVLMTGEGTIASAVAAMRAGALDYILKPFKPSIGVPVLNRSLEVRRLRMEVNELQRREQEKIEVLARFFSVSRDLLCIAGVDGYFKQVNNAWVETLGHSEETLISCPFFDFVHPDDKELTVQEMSRLLGGGYECVGFENRYRHADGAYRWIQWSTTCSGDLIYAAARDVTDQRRISETLRQAKEAAEQGSRAKGEFLSRMSHELRTPLNAILGFAQLLELRFKDPQIVEAARFIIKGGRHLLELINEVLDLSRIESGRMNMSIESVSASEVLDQAVELVQPLADAAGIGILVEHPPERSTVMADRQRLLQVLINLLSNAIKYNKPSGNVRVRCLDESGQKLRFEITDDGHGISAADQQKLFEPFQRFGDQQIEGTGLGLALSERFVRHMQGRLSLLQSSERGSTFSIELNRAEDRVQEFAVREGAASGIPFDNLSGTVLYVEDNMSNIRLLEILFAKSENLKLIPVTQGRIGIDLAREHQPDLILLDLHLPDLSGREVLQKLKSDPATESVPVAVLSAEASPSAASRLLSEGANEYLTKPLDLDRLFEVLERHLPIAC